MTNGIVKGLLKEAGMNNEKPHYCKECGKCRNIKTIYNNLKVKNNTGWTHDIYCNKLSKIVYGM